LMLAGAFRLAGRVFDIVNLSELRSGRRLGARRHNLGAVTIGGYRCVLRY